MNNKDNNKSSMVKVVKREGISAIWLVPIIALMFGAYLIVKSYLDKGTMITLELESATGIVAGKTEVKYRGLTVGKVLDIDISKDLNSVILDIEIIPGAESSLTEHTVFWIVDADITLQGVSGLDTLLSGSYIAIQPDMKKIGKSQRKFTALKEEPPLDSQLPGLHITLQTKTLGSMHRNAPVSYKQMTVGRVTNYHYDEMVDAINLEVFIEPKYAHLVKTNTRFWNASGFEITGNLTKGLKVKTQSLASIISGGIAFDQPNYLIGDNRADAASNGHRFDLHSDYQEAQMGYEITLNLALNSGLDIGVPIIYQGITMGQIEELKEINTETKKIVSIAKVNPRFANYLTTDAQFYVVKPQIDLSGVTDVNALLKGPHIKVRPSLLGEKRTSFNVYNERPALKFSEPGLHLRLIASNVASLRPGSNIYYKHQIVGSVQAVRNIAVNEFSVEAFIKPEFQSFVTTKSKFWNTSGVRVSGNLQGFEVQTSSLQAILTGGIAFSHNEETPGDTPKNGDEYTLYGNADLAKQYKKFELTMLTAAHVRKGTRVMYRGEVMGSIHGIEHKDGVAKLDVGILPQFEYILRENSKFWIVTPEISLTGLSDTDALFGGAYISFSAGDGATTKKFNVLTTPPSKSTSEQGLQLVLTASSGSIVSPSSPISYRGIVVGQVDNVALEKLEDDVAISVTIDEKYRHLVNEYTRFYNASGVTIEGSIGNMLIDTESMDSILKGGISFINSNENRAESPLQEGSKFTLFKNIHNAKAAGIAIKIQFEDIGGLRTNMKIKHQDQDIGFVERIDFAQEGYSATAFAYLNDSGKKFAVEGSKFWLAKLDIGLVGTKNVSALLEGDFIKILPGNGKEQTSFTAEQMPPVIKKLPYGLNLTLTAPQLGSVRVDNPVLYKQVKVGKVIGVDLASTADKVNIYIAISDRYAPLVSTNSVFWNTSGFKVDAGIFSGVEIDSESMETILAGGVAFATPPPENGEALIPASEFSEFPLHQEFDSEWHEWQPKIAIKE